MKKMTMFSCLIALMVVLNACNKNAVDSASTPVSARSAGDSSTTVTGGKVSFPPSIFTYLVKNYPDAVMNATLIDAQGNYVILITMDGVRKRVVFTPDGTFSKIIDSDAVGFPIDSTFIHG